MGNLFSQCVRKRAQPKPSTGGSYVLESVSEHNPAYTNPEQRPLVGTNHAPISLGSAVHLTENEEIAITSPELDQSSKNIPVPGVHGVPSPSGSVVHSGMNVGGAATSLAEQGDGNTPEPQHPDAPFSGSIVHLDKSNREEAIIAGTEPEQGDENIHIPGDHEDSLIGSVFHSSEDGGVVITMIQATGLVFDSKSIPIGFYIVVWHSGLKWRTETKCLSVDNDMVEWDGGMIPIPPDMSAIVRLEICTSSRSESAASSKEQLQELLVTVEQLLDHNSKCLPFKLLPKDGDIVSPFSSLLIAIGRPGHAGNELTPLRVLDPQSSITVCCGQLKNMTDKVHAVLSRYGKHRDKQDLERSIERFESAVNACLPGHPCRATVRSNLALVKVILYKVNSTGIALDAPLAIYYHALSASPLGHSDRPSMLVHLAILHLARFEKRPDKNDVTRAKALLHQAVEISPPDSHEKWGAFSILRLCAGREAALVPSRPESSIGQDFTSDYSDKAPQATYINQLIERYEQSGNLDDLRQATSLLESLLNSTSFWDPQYTAYLQSFGGMLLWRFSYLGMISDLEQAVSILADVVELTPDGHPSKPHRLSSLGVSLLSRFKRLGELGDIERAILTLQNALEQMPDRHPDKPGVLDDLGDSFHFRFERLGQLSDLEQAISALGDSVKLTSNDHPDKPRRLICLTGSFAVRFSRLGELDDLNQAILMLQDAIHLRPEADSLSALSFSLITRFECSGQSGDLETAISMLQQIPDGHPNKIELLSGLSNLADCLLVRFQYQEQPHDIEMAISMSRDADRLTPDGHPHKPDSLNTLSLSFETRFERYGDPSDLDQAISHRANAIELIPDDHHVKSLWLNNLGNSFLVRFDRFGEIGDLDRGLSAHQHAVELTPNGHPDKYHRLSKLGISFSTRFEHLGDFRDLEKAILTLVQATELVPDDYPPKPGMLGILGNAFFVRFERLGEFNDLEQAISWQRDGLHLMLDDHPDKSVQLGNLGRSLYTRFQHLGEMANLDGAISMLTRAIHLTSGDHPQRPPLLSNLSSFLIVRFEHLGELNDLDQAISLLGDAVHLLPDGHPDKPAPLNNLSASFLARFQRLGELNDLEQAILTLEDAVHLMPDGHPEKPGRLSNLGSAFSARFKRLGNLSDLERAISVLGEAAELISDVHSDRPTLLTNLGSSFVDRFQHFGELSDLDKAISKQQAAVQLTHESNPDKHVRLSNLGASFLTRFDHLGELSDLENGISTFRDATELIPDHHPNRPALLSNLGNSYLSLFRRLGELSDLEGATSTLGDAVHLMPAEHPDKPALLSNFGDSLFARFRRLEVLSDLEDALSRQYDAIQLVSDGHPDKPRHLSNFGVSLVSRFERLGELSDLERAMAMQWDAVHLTPDRHADKAVWLSQLGNSFLVRFRHLEELSDLEQAISIFGDVIELTPDGHPDRPGRLNSLASSFFSRFDRLADLSDLEQAISILTQVTELTPDGHPGKSNFLNNLGSTFIARFNRLGQLTDITQAASLYSHSTSHTASPPSVRFFGSLLWISCARTSGHHSLLHAYSTAVNLLPQLAWLGHSLSHRYQGLVQGADVVRDAAATALDSGYPETAVEWLEQGRSIVWGELFQLRSSYDELSAAHPDYARKLQRLSAELEQAGATTEKSLSLSTIAAQAGKQSVTESLEQVAKRHRMLAIEREKLLQEIRTLPGFESFLLHKKFSQLRASAHSGPVVILNASKNRCDALIVLADVENVVHVPLSNFSLERSEALQISVNDLVRQVHAMPIGERAGHSMTPDRSSQWKSILSSLWKCVVKPVLDSLAFVVPGKQPRIFWCPTGPLTFLPIHAAGFYDVQYSQSGHKIFDFTVSSYVPTLSVLAPPSTSHAVSSNILRFLAVRQPQSDGLPHLPGVDAELEHIATIISNSSARVTLTESSHGTVEEVLELMKKADWVHFSCHGVQDAAKPTDSGLCLADGRRLKLSDIVALSRTRGGLTFLSACQTAKGDKSLSDEVIHIAAGMLFAGYGGVIGTMWSISDMLAPDVAKGVYEQLFQQGVMPDYRDAARTLQDSIGHMRDSGASFSDWIPFIHVGL